MDRQRDFLDLFTGWLATVDEAYLIGLANKGLYNRSLKELGDGSGVVVEVGDAEIACSFPDGQTSRLTTDVKTNRCTCPSRSICKHTLMGLLHVKQGLSDALESAISEKKVRPLKIALPDYSALLALGKKEIKKWVTDKVYQDILYRLKFGVETRIEEGPLLTIEFIEEGITARFPQMEPIRDAICSCKSADFCRHRVEAVLHYQLFKGATTLEALEEITTVKVAREPLIHVQRLLEQMLLLGLSRLPENCLDQLEQMAVICHSSDLPNVEKLLRSLKTEVELYVNKHVSSSQQAVLRRMTELYSTLLAIAQTRDTMMLKRLVGDHKSSYVEIPPLELIGVGASAFRSKTGYEGITYYFYNEKLGRWLTYTNSRPTYYEETSRSRGAASGVQGMYRENAPWGLHAAGEEFSKARIKLLGGKMNGSFRLSSSEQSTGTLLTRKPFADVRWGQWYYDDWMQLLGRVSEQSQDGMNEREEQGNLFLLAVSRWGLEHHFDPIKQEFSMPIYDGAERALEVWVPYSPLNKPVIEKLEACAKWRRVPATLLGKVYLHEGRLVVYPITFYYGDGRVDNLMLDRGVRDGRADESRQGGGVQA